MMLEIFIAVIVPVFLIIGVGALLDRRFTLDLPTLSKLNFYVFVPALSFVKLLEAKLPGETMLKVGVFSVVHAVVLFAIAWFFFALPRLRAQQSTMAMGVIFYNIGNYGLPLIALASALKGWDADAQIGVVTTIIVAQNLLTFTLGVWLMERHVGDTRKALANIAKLPIIYAMALALLLRGLHLAPPDFLMIPLRYLSDGLIPIALLTLGVQLSRAKWAQQLAPVTSLSAMRLLASPVLAALLVIPFGFTTPTSSVLIIAAGFPVAVNLSILAAEYRRDEDLASQSIFLTTLVSAVTVAVLIALVR